MFHLDLSVVRKYLIMKLDVNNEFLNGKLTRDLYPNLLKGMNLAEKEVGCFTLLKKLYGLIYFAFFWHDEM